MPYPLFTASTLDDVLREVIEDLLTSGEPVEATRGGNVERTGVLLEIENPRARLSLTETRGRLFSCLGELCWYLSKSNDLASIEYYVSQYAKEADRGVVFGGYGPRLFDWQGTNQVANVISLLKRHPASRRAVVQIFDRGDIPSKQKNIPCTCLFHFIVRNQKVHMITYMRSNDVYIGLPHDVFAFTMLQEIVARSLGLELGTYKHTAGSLHLYEENRAYARELLDEGWQSTQSAMPAMPDGDPWASIALLSAAEEAIRTKGANAVDALGQMDPYWADLVRLLQIFRWGNDGDTEAAERVRTTMSTQFYEPFIGPFISRRARRRGRTRAPRAS